MKSLKKGSQRFDFAETLRFYVHRWFLGNRQIRFRVSKSENCWIFVFLQNVQVLSFQSDNFIAKVWKTKFLHNFNWTSHLPSDKRRLTTRCCANKQFEVAKCRFLLLKLDARLKVHKKHIQFNGDASEWPFCHSPRSAIATEGTWAIHLMYLTILCTINLSRVSFFRLKASFSARLEVARIRQSNSQTTFNLLTKGSPKNNSLQFFWILISGGLFSDKSFQGKCQQTRIYGKLHDPIEGFAIEIWTVEFLLPKAFE